MIMKALNFNWALSQNRCLYCKLLLHHSGGSEITDIIFV